MLTVSFPPHAVSMNAVQSAKTEISVFLVFINNYSFKYNKINSYLLVIAGC